VLSHRIKGQVMDHPTHPERESSRLAQLVQMLENAELRELRHIFRVLRRQVVSPLPEIERHLPNFFQETGPRGLALSAFRGGAAFEKRLQISP
jgi:hypothetical protein